MWDEQKRFRFQQLRLRQGENELTEAERAELANMVQELEAAEAVYLAPATAQLRQEKEALESQNRTLEALARRKEALVSRLSNALAQAQFERP